MGIDKKAEWFIFLFVAVGLGFRGILYAAPDCTSHCHQELAGKTHPEMECASCHQPTSLPHPEGGKQAFQPTKKESCMECHEELAKSEYVHAPVKNGDCLQCHSLHAGAQENLLRGKETEICMGCHQEVFPPEKNQLHGAILKGSCSACHLAHSASRKKLLRNGYPIELVVNYNDDEYALCFSCHSRQLLMFPDTSFATDFRDGERNLHYLHVNKERRGRNCKLCHEMHAAQNPKLMADTVEFGNWQMPLNFKKTEWGGSCAPGCHRPYRYNRQTGG